MFFPATVAAVQPAVGRLTVVVRASGDEDVSFDDFERTLDLTEPLRMAAQAWAQTYQVPEACVALETAQGQILDLDRNARELGWTQDSRVILHAVPADDDYAYPSQRMGTNLPGGSRRSMRPLSMRSSGPLAPPMGTQPPSSSGLAPAAAGVVVTVHAQLDDGSRLKELKLPLDMTSPLSSVAAVWAASMGLPALCVGLETPEGEPLPLAKTPLDLGWRAGAAPALLAVPLDESYRGAGPSARKSFRAMPGTALTSLRSQP